MEDAEKIIPQLTATRQRFLLRLQRQNKEDNSD